MKIYFSASSSSITTVENKITNDEDIDISSSDIKLNILFWNGFWNLPFFGMGVGNRGFVSNKCKYQNCYTTNQRKKIFKSNTRIDAVVVHGIDEDLARLARTKVRIFTSSFIAIKVFVKNTGYKRNYILLFLLEFSSNANGEKSRTLSTFRLLF